MDFEFVSRWTGSLRRAAAGALDLLFPPQRACALCRAPVSLAWNSSVCDGCLERIPRIGRSRCATCGRATGTPVRRCAQCARTPPALDYVRSFGVYDGYLRDLVHALKYRGELGVAEGLGELMAWVVALDGRFGRIDRVVAVPLHPSRLRERGFNQAEWLAREVGRQLGKPLDQPVLRTRQTQSQSKMEWNARAANVRDAFAALPERARGRHFLLVDDVYTTGSTLSAAATALKRAGCRRCTAVCVAASSLDREFARRS